MPSEVKSLMSSRPPTLLALPSYLAGHVSMLGNRTLVSVLKQNGLRLPQFAVLVALSDFGALAPHEIASRLQTDRSHVSTYVEVLLRAGLVGRTPDPLDRRRVSIELTTSGRDLVGRMSTAATESERDLLTALDADEQDTLRSLLMKVLASAESGSADQETSS